MALGTMRRDFDPRTVTEALPTFRYHPDPIATGSIVRSSAVCRCCTRARGYIYTGPVYSPEGGLDDALCPWCIADGSAARRFGASFTDEAGVGDYGSWEAVPASVVTEIAERTPAFTGWQQGRWWTHCGDGAAYLGPAGRAELTGNWTAALPAIQADVGYEGAEWDEYLELLDSIGSPTAYVFRCLHCGQLGGYSDSH